MPEVDLSTVLAALIGAVFGATANGLVRDWQDRQAKKRELRGLLSLIESEVRYNRSIVPASNETAATNAVQHLRTDTWNSWVIQRGGPYTSATMANCRGHVWTKTATG